MHRYSTVPLNSGPGTFRLRLFFKSGRVLADAQQGTDGSLRGEGYDNGWGLFLMGAPSGCVEDILIEGIVMRTINRVLAVAAALSLAGITGCGAQGGMPSGPSPATTASSASAGASAAAGEAIITIKDFAYEVPGSVKPGATVTVRNADSAPHTMTAKDKGGFDVEVKAVGTVTFEAPAEPGEYGIICTFHPQMSGTLVVK